ncbi:MAG: FtsB family cell division protein [Dehalococcoidia bacterium]
MRKFPLSFGPVFLALVLLGFMGGRLVYSRFQEDTFAEARDTEQARVAELTQVRDEARRVKAYAASDQFVEHEARRRWGWAREGEVPIVVHGPASDDPAPAGKRWWQRLFPHE